MNEQQEKMREYDEQRKLIEAYAKSLGATDRDIQRIHYSMTLYELATDSIAQSLDIPGDSFKLVSLLAPYFGDDDLIDPEEDPNQLTHEQRVKIGALSIMTQMYTDFVLQDPEGRKTLPYLILALLCRGDEQPGES